MSSMSIYETSLSELKRIQKDLSGKRSVTIDLDKLDDISRGEIKQILVEKVSERIRKVNNTITQESGPNGYF